jgi:peptidoglycan/xylan/chitin deacetylase (PgdA/CDA1 family)
MTNMNRREFVEKFGLGVAALGLSSKISIAVPRKQPQVAITMDDFSIFDIPTLSGEARNQAILDALDKHHLKAGAFVAGKYVDNEKNLPLLRRWSERGHLIGNHTYSHGYYPRADFGKYTQDILQNEALLRQFPRFRKFLRFPYLKEGNTIEQRDKMRAFLREHEYRNAHVTIDNSDWYIDGRLRARLKNNPKADLTPYKEFYLNHVARRATYYDDLATKVLGRSPRHTLLIHHNVLNGLFLGDLLQMFKQKGWKLISAEEAYKDSLFSLEPGNLPAGESIIWALAKESGKFEKVLRYPAEDGDYEKPEMDALGL